MRDPVKLLGFVFWLFFFNSGQCQECLRKNINYENTEPVEKASYSDGETVRLNCMTGFTGMYRLKCEKGEWKRTTGRTCAKRKCSHPGDTANGDFKLIGGSEFVFGATVLYSCKKGFEMTSRINQRTCRAQGWDNTVPVCEAVKCQAIRTDVGVTASGNTEEGSYGDVIHFECVSSDKKIHGSSDIHCTERGEWSDSVPTCKEITCTPPDILNGRVLERMQEYPKDAILKYSCSKGFKPREGIPRCAKFGWTLNPECDDLTCQLMSRRFGVNKINPEGKTLFRVGESVEITCTERYWFSTKETIRSFTCQENGKWDHEPVCEEIRCEVPRDQHVRDPEYYFWRNTELGAVKTYYCMPGYEQKAAVARCTREGWTPKPLCAVKMCAVPNIPNADIEGEQRQKYRIYSKIQYKCHRGFEPEQPLEITCYDYGWTHIQQCTGEKICGAFPSVHHGKIKQTKQTKQTSRDGDTIAFECDPGFKPTQSFIKCDRGKWETPVCEDVRCGIPPKVENAFITSKPKEFYVEGSSVTYECGKSFLMNGENTVFCRSGSWEEAPTCTEVTKPLNTTVEDSKRSPDIEGPFKPGETITFSWNRQGQKLKGQREISCQSNGEWSSPFPKCEEVKCVANMTEKMRSDANEDERTGTEISVKPGRTITLTCDGEGVKLQGEHKVTCQSNGEWSSPFPKCVAETTDEVKCVANLTEKMRSDANKDEHTGTEISVNPERTITLTCLGAKVKVQGRNKITCQSNGEWNVPFPKCVRVEDLITERSPDIESPFKPGQTLTFSWNKPGLKLKEKEITCRSNGEWSSPFPKCEEVKSTAHPMENATSHSPEIVDQIRLKEF